MADYHYQIETVQVLDSPMEVFVFEATQSRDNKPGPAIVLAQHIPVGHTGIENDEFTLATAQRLADAGYVVAVPFIFHWWDKAESMDLKRQESRDDWTVLDIQAAFDLLKKRSDVLHDRIAIVGHCWGGRVAWLGACHVSDFAALGVFYGGNIKKGLGQDNPPPILLAGNINGPVIGFFGNDDVNPSPDDVDDYSSALAKAGVRHEFHQYDGAGHAFQNFPVAEKYNAQASEDAWSKLLEFLKEELG